MLIKILAVDVFGSNCFYVTHRGFFLLAQSIALLARAISSWSTTSENNLCPSSDASGALLSFSQGDIISVLQQRDDWWFGQLNGTQGWFPKSYVTLEPAGNSEYEDY